MEHISTVIKANKLANNVINVNLNNPNVYNATSKEGKFRLDRQTFTPNTQETKLAEDIAIHFNDLDNYAFYVHVVKQLGVSRAYAFYRGIQEEIKEKLGTQYAIGSPKKYFSWKFKKGLL